MTVAQHIEKVMDEQTWRLAYAKGFLAPRYAVPAVQHYSIRFNSFEFYFKMGVINAICDATIEEWRRGNPG